MSKEIAFVYICPLIYIVVTVHNSSKLNDLLDILVINITCI